MEENLLNVTTKLLFRKKIKMFELGKLSMPIKCGRDLTFKDRRTIADSAFCIQQSPAFSELRTYIYLYWPLRSKVGNPQFGLDLSNVKNLT